jgi:outer membrane protein assembly factor BamD (BamD/ComL family)
MAKQQRRPQARSTKDTPVPQKPAQIAAPSAPVSPPAPPPVPIRRSTYVEAVALYEQGLERLQQHDYAGAADRLETVLKQFPDEKELHERVKLYLNVCRKQAAAVQASPKTIEERLYASTLAINGGRYDEAISHLRLVRDEDPDNDHALYMLAVAHAQRGELAEAVAHVERAIAMNPENRALARTDPDLDPLRDDESFRTALEAPSLPRLERRRPVRPRSAR